MARLVALRFPARDSSKVHLILSVTEPIGDTSRPLWPLWSSDVCMTGYRTASLRGAVKRQARSGAIALSRRTGPSCGTDSCSMDGEACWVASASHAAAHLSEVGRRSKTNIY